MTVLTMGSTIPVSNVIGDVGIAAIASALEINRSLKSLSLYKNAFADQGALALASMLKINTVLEKLNLSGNYFGPVGGQALGAALEDNTSLLVLDLATIWSFIVGNPVVGNSAALACANSLKKNRTLKTLILRDQGVTSIGAKALAETLKYNDVLTVLDLGYHNSIDSEGAQALASALKINTALQVLSLSDNWAPFGDIGAQAFAEALQVNSVLTSLYIQGNSISDSSANALASALQCNYVLTNLGRDASSYDAQINDYLNRNLQCAAAAQQCPLLNVSLPIVPKNSVVPLDTTHLQITNTQRNQTLFGNFTINEINNGQFVGVDRKVISSFSQTAVNSGQVFILADSSGLPISANVTASIGDFSTCVIPLLFDVNNVSTTSLPFTTIPAVGSDGGSSNTSLGAIIGGVAAGVTAVGVGIFAWKRRRRKQSTQVGALPPTDENSIPMVQNPLHGGSQTTYDTLNPLVAHSIYSGAAPPPRPYVSLYDRTSGEPTESSTSDAQGYDTLNALVAHTIYSGAAPPRRPYVSLYDCAPGESTDSTTTDAQGYEVAHSRPAYYDTVSPRRSDTRIDAYVAGVPAGMGPLSDAQGYEIPQTASSNYETSESASMTPRRDPQGYEVPVPLVPGSKYSATSRRSPNVSPAPSSHAVYPLSFRRGVPGQYLPCYEQVDETQSRTPSPNRLRRRNSDE